MKVWADVGNGTKKYVERDVAVGEGWAFEVPPENAPIEAPASNTYRLSEGEKEKIYQQTGKRFDDYAHYKRWQRENGMRDIEPGERGDVIRKQVTEWVAGGCQGPCPAGRSPVRPMPQRNVDLNEIRYKIRNGLLTPPKR